MCQCTLWSRPRNAAYLIAIGTTVAVRVAVVEIDEQRVRRIARLRGRRPVIARKFAISIEGLNAVSMHM